MAWARGIAAECMSSMHTSSSSYFGGLNLEGTLMGEKKTSQE